MFEGMLSTFRWLASLGAKFVRVAPGSTAVVVLATLISQISALLAFFLPLKVIILLGSDGMPRYFPPAFAEIDRDFLVVALSIATVVFYGVHLLAEKITTLSTERGASRLLGRSQKMVLFENQDETAKKGYQRYSYALAGGVFVVLAFATLLIIYPELSWLLIGYIAIMILLTWVGFNLSGQFREILDTRLSDLLGIVGSVGFLLAFAYLVLDFIFWSPPGLLLAIIALLLSRQVFTRSTGMIAAIVGLNVQRLKLDALFFHGKVLLPEKDKVDRGIWSLLTPGRRDQWVQEVLSEYVQDVDSAIECNWWQTGEPNVGAIHARTSYPGKVWLIKVFDARRSGLALQEANLLTAMHAELPAPEFLGATQVEQFHCHVFGLPPGGLVGDQGAKTAAERIRGHLLALEPAQALVKRYKRSRPLLWQQLDDHFFERLRLAADGAAFDLLKQLEAARGDWCKRLRELPLWLVNAKINPDNIYVGEDGAEYLLDWGRWSLEPAGAGWPIKNLSALGVAAVEASEKRPSLAEIEPGMFELAALSDSMYKAFKRQRYLTALELIPDILERLSNEDAGS